MIPGNLSAPAFAFTGDNSSRGGLRALGGAPGVMGLNLGGPLSWRNDGTYGPPLQMGAGRSDAEGSPGTPSLVLNYQGVWSFKWAARAGSRTISVNVKQADNRSPYPSMIVRANAALGVGADVVGTSAGGAGWVTIGPISVSPSVSGVLIVELWNNTAYWNSPCFFDHIFVT